MDEYCARDDDAPLSVLMLEDSPLDADLAMAILERGDVRANVRRVETEADFVRCLTGDRPDLILSDYALPTYDGLSALSAARRFAPDVPFIFVSGTMGEEVAIEALKNGATDYVLKQRLERLVPSVRRAVAESRERAERRKVETALRESESRFRRLADSAPVLIWMTDPAGHLEYANRPFVGFTGATPAQLDGTGWTPLIHPDERDDVAAGLLAAHRAEAEFRRLVRLRRADGEWRWHQAVGVPRTGSDGTFAGLVGSLTDVTDFIRTEEALREADRRKDEFLAVLAHELRNPLAPVRNAIQILKLAGSNPEHAAFAHGLIERQVAQLCRLVDDLLDVSRVTRDKITLHREQVLLADVVKTAVENSRPALDGAGHTLTVNLPPNPVVLNADAARLAQVLTNLLNNAAKYTPPGGRVEITAERNGSNVVVQVRDTGIGLTEQDRARIFEPFAQAGRVPGRPADGLGVGLALVKRLVELHDGTVDATSDGPDQGSTFRIGIPIGFPDEPNTGSHPVRTTPVSILPLRKVLVVDDVNDSGESLGKLLRLMGLDVCVVHDGPAALDAARRFRPDVALLNLGMPGMDGLEVARRWRQDIGLRQAPLVAVTGYGRDVDRRRSHEAGFVAHLVKPVDTDQLRRVLARLA